MHRLLVTVTALVAALVLVGSAGAWTWPADGPVLRPFQLGADVYAGGQHRGIDVAGQEGSPIRAPAGGTVTFAGSLPTHGRGVTISTADGYSVTLVHLGTIAVAKGETLAEGATVGLMGTSGEAEHAQPSVHLGIRRTAEAEGYVDPIGLLPARPAAPAPNPPPAAVPAPSPAPAPPVAVAPTPPPAAPPAPGPAPAPTAPDAAPTVTAPPAVAPAAGPDAGLVVAAPRAAADAPFVVESAARPDHRVAERSRPPVRRLAQPSGQIAKPDMTARDDVSDLSATSTTDVVESAARVTRVAGRIVAVDARLASPAALSHEPRAAERGGKREVDDARPSTSGSPERARPAPQLASPTAARVVAVAAADPRDARAGAATTAVEPKVAGGLDPTTVALGAGLVLAAAAMAAWMAARRIGGHGALLPHDADLLRERDPAHRARVHDRGRRRLRPAPAAARP